MISSEQEQASQSGGGAGGGGSGSAPSDAKDWQDSVAKIQADMPKYQNRPLVVDLRK
jgi:hypothetical protein